MQNYTPEQDEFIKQIAGKPFAITEELSRWEAQAGINRLVLYMFNPDGTAQTYNHDKSRWEPTDGYRDNAKAWSLHSDELRSINFLDRDFLTQMGVRYPEAAEPAASDSHLDVFSAFINKLDTDLEKSSSENAPANLSFYVWGASFVLGGFLKAVAHSRIGERVRDTLEKVGNAVQNVGFLIGSAGTFESLFHSLWRNPAEPEYHSKVDKFIHGAYTMAKNTVTGHLPGRTQETDISR